MSVGGVRLLLEEIFQFWILRSDFFLFTSFCLFLFGKEMLYSCLDFFPYLGERENNSPIRRDAFEDTAK